MKAVFKIPLCFLALTFSVPASAGQRPNILMVAVDDLRPQLGCYGEKQIHSPNIDRLAASGVRFDRSYCSVAVCGASRGSLMSGNRPQTTGCWDAHTLLRSKMPEVLTLPGHLKANGYQTAFFGKVYHSPSDDRESWTVDVDKLVPEQPGRGSVVLFGDKYKKQYKDVSFPDAKAFPSTENGGDVPDHAYEDGDSAERAVALLSRFAKSEQPFFLAVGFRKPHLPFAAPAKYWDLYERGSIAVPSREKMKDSVPWARSSWGELKNYPDIGRDVRELDDATTRRLIHGYYASVSYMDAQVGMLLDGLKANGLSENTIVFLWGDHGWYLGDYGEWCKHTNYEIATRVPFIWHVPTGLAPAMKTGSSERLVELLDIYPTLCELAGLKTPPHLHGHSLVPLLQNPSAPWREAAISQYKKIEPLSVTENGKTRTQRVENLGTSVRTEQFRFTQWKRVADGTVSAEELVDMKQDPRSTVNVVALPEYAGELPLLRVLAAQSATGITPPSGEATLPSSHLKPATSNPN